MNGHLAEVPSRKREGVPYWRLVGGALLAAGGAAAPGPVHPQAPAVGPRLQRYCNCRETGAPFFRINYCGCQCEDATKEFDGTEWVKVAR